MDNKEQQNIVRNYNRRVKYASNSGTPKKYLPQTYKLRELRRAFKSKAGLDRELKHLQSFTKQSLSEKANVNFNASKWEIKHLTSLRDLAIKSYQKRVVSAQRKLEKGYMGQNLKIRNLQAKIATLNLDLNTVTESQYRSFKAAINEFIDFPSLQYRGYRGFLSELDWIMDNMGIPEADRTKFFNKFKKLTPEQFQYLYDNNDVIDKIYDLVDSPPTGGLKWVGTSSEGEAPRLIKELMENVDVYIEDARANG